MNLVNQMSPSFSRIWNVSGKTWIPGEQPGPWAVDNSSHTNWGIINTETGETKNIGPVRMSGTNHFDRAMAEVNRRNAEVCLERGFGAAEYNTACDIDPDLDEHSPFN